MLRELGEVFRAACVGGVRHVLQQLTRRSPVSEGVDELPRRCLTSIMGSFQTLDRDLRLSRARVDLITLLVRTRTVDAADGHTVKTSSPIGVVVLSPAAVTSGSSAFLDRPGTIWSLAVLTIGLFAPTGGRSRSLTDFWGRPPGRGAARASS